VDDLANLQYQIALRRETYDCRIRESDYKSVFRCRITILGLSDKSLSGIVICFAFPTLHTDQWMF
jgi:hypothetical protein